ncbi:MAG TPA: hypothetical protein VMA09_17240 [Candidatus Binataceae bacterium]|nr:hypothetical protein [Candidatus Binataceae bacterium]
MNEALPIASFFFIGFVIVLLIVKLMLEQYSIETVTLSRALVGALIAAKVVLILDKTPVARSFKSYPRIIPVTAKATVYALSFILVTRVERAFDSWRHGGIAQAQPAEIQNNMYRVLAVALAVGIVFAIYFALDEISSHVGKGVLWKLFFSKTASRSEDGAAADSLAPPVSRRDAG